jgi:regulator of sirC expression with transglutaminase-like and TPR domain
MAARELAEAILRDAGAADDGAIDLAGTALGFALYDRPELDLAPYRAHLATLVDEMEGAAGCTGALERAVALRLLLVDRHSYRGDNDTYDDLANADLARVIDRRRGLPVAIAILWLHVARACRWDLAGLNLQGHFLLRLRGEGRQLIIDPFNGGEPVSDDNIRAYVERALDGDERFQPERLAPVGNRAILMRLRNNVRTRLAQAERTAEVLRVLESMALVAPRDPVVPREMAGAQAELGNLNAAMASLQRAIELSSPAEQVLLTQELKALRAKLN